MSARYLVIDDLRIFKPDYFSMFKDYSYEVTYARTSEEGLKALKDGDWDCVYLDHDLGGDDTVKPCLDYVLEFRDAFYDTTFFIHTSNSYEQDSMSRQLMARNLQTMRTAAANIFDIDYDLYAKAVD